MTNIEPKSGKPFERSRQQRRARGTHIKLMDAARAVFAEKGLDLTTIDDITERADVGKGTFYYHFRTKERLIRTLMENTLSELMEDIDRKCGGTTDLPELLDSLIGAHIEFFSNRWEDFVLYYQGRADLTLQEGYSGLETPFFEYLERIELLIDSAIKHRVPKPALRRIAFAVAGFLSGYYSFAAISSEEENIDETFRALRGAMVASLARFIREAAPPASTTTGSTTSR